MRLCTAEWNACPWRCCTRYVVTAGLRAIGRSRYPKRAVVEGGRQPGAGSMARRTLGCGADMGQFCRGPAIAGICVARCTRGHAGMVHSRGNPRSTYLVACAAGGARHRRNGVRLGATGRPARCIGAVMA